MLIRIERARMVVRGPVRAGTAVMEVLKGWWKQSLPKWATQTWKREQLQGQHPDCGEDSTPGSTYIPGMLNTIQKAQDTLNNP